MTLSIFDSELDETAVKPACEQVIAGVFGLDTTVGITTSDEPRYALVHAPDRRNAGNDSENNVIFVIAPATAESVIAYVRAAKQEYEKLTRHSKIIFWYATLGDVQ